MTVRFRVTPAIFYGAQRAVMHHIRWMRFGGYFVVLVFPLFMIGITLAYSGTVVGAVRNNAVTYLALVLVWLVGVPLLQRWAAARTLRSTPAFQGEIEYSFTQSGVDTRTDVSTGHLAWEAFIRAVETKDFFLLYHNKTMATFLPKLAFTGASERDAFRELVSLHLGARAAWRGELGLVESS